MTIETKSGLRIKADKMSGTSKEMKTDSEAYEQKVKIPEQQCVARWENFAQVEIF